MTALQIALAIIFAAFFGSTLGVVCAGMLFSAKRGDERLRVWVVTSETSGSHVDTRIN